MRINDISLLPSVISISSCDLGVSVSGLTDDSRKVLPGYLFIAKRGFHDDGARFITDALEKGACAVVALEPPEGIPAVKVASVTDFEREALSEFYNGVEKKIRFAGITGTKGKTTAAFLLYEYLQSRGEAVCYIGTIGIYDKVRNSVRNLYTTPDVFSLYAVLDEKYKTGHSLCIMEVSSHALAQLRINGITYSVAGFTNLSHDHLDYHHTMEEYFNVKKTLFTDHLKGTAIINCHDNYGKRLFNELQEMDKIGYGDGSAHPFTVHESKDITTINCCGFAITTGMPGPYNAENAVLAAYMLKTLGFDDMNYRFGMNGIPGRLEKISVRGITVYVDYAHSPDSLEKVLELLSSRATKRLITVFGCTGDRDRTKRPIMAAISEKYSDHTVITSDDPHSENPEAICREVEIGMTRKNYTVEPDRKKAIAFALQYAEEGDIILIAGKGHEVVQIFDGYEVPYNDGDVVRELLRFF